MKGVLPILMLAGCAAATSGRSPATAPGTCLTGTVFNAGLDEQDRPGLRGPGAPVFLAGPHARAILSMTGAVVTACGRIQSEIMIAGFFELRAVDGLQAYSGELARSAGVFVVRPGPGRAEVPLSDAPPQFSELVGRAVWVSGDWVGAQFAVKAFGVVSGGGGNEQRELEGQFNPQDH